jgi:BTB/POZ domain
MPESVSMGSGNPCAWFALVHVQVRIEEPPRTIELLLQHMYSVPGEISESEVVPLFQACDKFEVAGLRQRCLAILRQVVSACLSIWLAGWLSVCLKASSRIR